MRAYLTFVKKEFIESLRTYKLIIMLTIFTLFGIMNPLVAKLTPELLKMLETEGMVISLPDPTAIDSFMQFFKNVGQMGVLVLVIIFAGIMANEFSRGTLVNILTKGLKRRTVILAKFTTSAIIWTLSYLLCLAVTYGYTAYFWDVTGLQNVFLAFSGLWLFGVLLISLLILGGTLFKTFSGSLLLCGGTVVVMMLLNIIPNVQKYNPAILLGDGTALLTNMVPTTNFLTPLIVCSVSVVVVITASIVVFDRKQI